jgi:alpha-L-arabinofuranosidase
MVDAEIEVTRDVIGDIAPEIFGGLLEHLGRCVYGGVWDLHSQRPRPDVLRAMRELAPTALRWPGGCFSAWYRWSDGIGPRDARPTRDRQFWTDNSAHWARAAGRDEVEFTTALGPPETHAFGTDEFLRYCIALDAEPLVVVNLGGGEPCGDGSPEEAASWVRYCNRELKAPRRVEWWGIGNETWGAHEPGHCPPAQYAARLHDFAKAMRAEDPAIKTIAPGVLVEPGAVAAWNDGVLRDAGAAIDALSLHWYFPGPMGRSRTHDETELRQIMTAGDTLGPLLDATIEGVDRVAGTERSLPIVIGEWGFMADVEEHFGASHWFCDGPFFAGCLHRFIERSDRVAKAYYAQLVNVLGPIQTDGDRHFVTTAFFVLLLYRRLLRRRAVRTVVHGDEMAVSAMPALERRLFGPRSATVARRALVVDACATIDERGTAVALANRRLDRAAQIRVAGLPPRASGALVATSAAELFARNSVERPDAVGWRVLDAQADHWGRCTIELAPGSVGVASFA